MTSKNFASPKAASNVSTRSMGTPEPMGTLGPTKAPPPPPANLQVKGSNIRPPTVGSLRGSIPNNVVSYVNTLRPIPKPQTMTSNASMFMANPRTSNSSMTSNASMFMASPRTSNSSMTFGGFKKGGKVSTASARADGCAVRGKTKGRIV